MIAGAMLIAHIVLLLIGVLAVSLLSKRMFRV